jgi:NitT/TauT family transport system substrate-binding protein
MKSKWMCRVSATLVAAVTLFAPAAFAQGKGESVRFQDFPGTGNMLVKVAIAKGYCEKYGIKCQLQVIPSGPLGAQALLAKSIEAGMFVPEVGIGAIQKGAKIKAVVGAAVGNVFILIAGNHVETPNAGKGFPAIMQDFKGKKIGVPARGSGAEISFDWMLKKAGMKSDDVTYVAVGAGNTAYAAITNKQVDGLMMFEPAGSMCDVYKTCKVIWRGAEDKEPSELYALNGGSTSNWFRQEYIDKNPHVIAAVISALKDAERFANDPANFKELQAIVTSYFKFDLPNADQLMAVVIKRMLDQHQYVARIDRNAVKSTIDFMVQTKQIDQPIPVSDVIFNEAPK